MLTSIDVKFILDIACLLASLRDKSRGGCRNFDWEGPKLWFRKDCWTLFVATCSSISQYWSRLVWEILLCEQRRTDHFLISLEFSLVAKCNAIFIKKISQLKSDIRSGGGDKWQMSSVELSSCQLSSPIHQVKCSLPFCCPNLNNSTLSPGLPG